MLQYYANSIHNEINCFKRVAVHSKISKNNAEVVDFDMCRIAICRKIAKAYAEEIVFNVLQNRLF